MEASVQTYDFGLITANLYVEDGLIRGILSTTEKERQEVSEYLINVKQKLCDALADKVKGTGVDHENIGILYRANYSRELGKARSKDTESKYKPATETGTLLKMARAFVEAL